MALGGTDLEAMKRATETLMTASQEFGKRLYEEAAASQASAGGGDGGAGATGGQHDDEVVDAEIVDEQGA